MPPTARAMTVRDWTREWTRVWTSHLENCRGRHTVDLHLAVANNLLDLALLLQIRKALPCQGAVDLKSVDQDGDGHEAVGLDILVELLRGRLVQDDGVLGLVLDCAVVSRRSLCVVVSSSPSSFPSSSRVRDGSRSGASL